MGFLSATAKYLLFFFNFLIFICGIVLVTLAAIGYSNQIKNVDGSTTISLNGFAIGIGVVITVVAFFGCCGAIKENSCMLTTYFVIVVIILILQIILGALAFVAVKNNSGDIEDAIRKGLHKTFDPYLKENSNSTYNDITDLQEAWSCCGIDGVTDFSKNYVKIPPSCCGAKLCTETNSYEGCLGVAKNFVTKGLHIMGGIAIGFAVVELLGAILACVVKQRA